MNIRERIKNQSKAKRIICPKLPLNMLVELTNWCNYACEFCNNKNMKRKKGNIDFENLKRILLEAYEFGVQEVGFHNVGEPLMYPYLIKAAKYAKDIGYNYVYTTTNGSLNVKGVGNVFDSLKFSINAGTRETYKKIHKKDTFSKVIENLKYLSQFRPELKLYVSYCVMDANRHEKEILKKLIENYVDDIIYTEAHNQSDYMNNFEDKKKKCFQIFNRLNITYEGYLDACCGDFEGNLIIADLNKMSIKEAWKSKKFKQLRLRHINNNLKGIMCYNCLNNIDMIINKI